MLPEASVLGRNINVGKVNEAVSDVSAILDGSTYPRLKKFHSD